jgi:hypothetical protein
LRIPGQVLDDALRLRISAFAEIRTARVSGTELDVLRVRHHDVGHGAGAQAAHAIGEQHGWYATQFLEAFGEQTQRRHPRLVHGEPNEPIPTPRQHGAEHLPACLGGPIEHQVLTRHRDPWPIRPPLRLPRGFGLRDGAAEVPGRASVAALPGDHQ